MTVAPEHIIRGLGPDDHQVREALAGLARALARGGDQVQDKRRNWQQQFSRCADWSAWQRGGGPAALAQVFGQQLELDPADQLLVLQTYYALVIKLVLAAHLAGPRQGQLLGVTTRRDLRALGRRLEHGTLLAELGALDVVQDVGLFSWYLHAWGQDTARAMALVVGRLKELALPAGGVDQDLLRPLYLALVPRSVRHRLGEYYTPDWLAQRVVRLTLGRDLGRARCRVLDPACGSGTFLVQLIRHARQRAAQQGADPRQTLEQLLERVEGRDLNPLAVLAARVNVLLALGPLLQARAGTVRAPVFTRDAVLAAGGPAGDADQGRFHYVVGNPPWINWEHLPADYRRLTRPQWERYQLFPHRGMDAILGQGKKDLATLITLVALDRCVRPGGRLGFLLPRGVLKSAGAARGFRRFTLPGGEQFAPRLVEDLQDLRPFAGASAQALLLVLRRDRAVSYPVPYAKWRRANRPRGGGPPVGQALQLEASPVDPEDPASAWLAARPGVLGALGAVLGPSEYRAHEGANSGGANGVYWVTPRGAADQGLVQVANYTKGARRVVPEVQAPLEARRLYPLLRGRDVARWRAEPSLQILMVQDPVARRGVAAEVLRRDSPATLAYLQRFQPQLTERPALRRYFRETDPWWSMFNIGRHTFARYKVVWREQARRFTAAVVGPRQGRAVVPDHKLMLVAAGSADEAHYLCAALNSVPVALAVAAYAVPVQISTHVLDHVAVPTFDRAEPCHRALVSLSRRAHRAATAEDAAAMARLEAELDRAAGELWGIAGKDQRALRRALQEL